MYGPTIGPAKRRPSLAVVDKKTGRVVGIVRRREQVGIPVPWGDGPAPGSATKGPWETFFDDLGAFVFGTAHPVGDLEFLLVMYSLWQLSKGKSLF